VPKPHQHVLCCTSISGWRPPPRRFSGGRSGFVVHINNRCLANWATVVCQKEELSTHWTRLYLSYSHISANFGAGRSLLSPNPPWRQPRGKWMVSLVITHTNATRIGWHLWEIDLRFAPGLPPGWTELGLWFWGSGAGCTSCSASLVRLAVDIPTTKKTRTLSSTLR